MGGGIQRSYPGWIGGMIHNCLKMFMILIVNLIYVQDIERKDHCFDGVRPNIALTSIIIYAI